jgi:hypothetical protein
MADVPAMVAPLEPMMVVFTVIWPKSSIRICTNGTRTALTDIVLASAAVALAIATRKALMLALEADAAVAAPMAYRTAFAAMLLVAAMPTSIDAVLTAETDAPLDADTVKEAETNLVALTEVVLTALTKTAT